MSKFFTNLLVLPVFVFFSTSAVFAQIQLDSDKVQELRHLNTELMQISKKMNSLAEVDKVRTSALKRASNDFSEAHKNNCQLVEKQFTNANQDLYNQRYTQFQKKMDIEISQIKLDLSEEVRLAQKEYINDKHYAQFCQGLVRLILSTNAENQ